LPKKCKFVVMRKKNNKTWSRKLNIYHRYNKKIGMYSFFRSNYKKILLVFAAFLAIIFVVNYFFNLEDAAEFIVNNYKTDIVFLVFYLSESILGLIPPDIFILWVKGFEEPYLMIGILGVISYLGGLTAYGIGHRLERIPKVRKYLEAKYMIHITKIKKWGGIFIVIAALLPLPYATVLLLAGMLKYPFARVLYLGTARIARFFIHAVVLFGVIS